LPVQTAAATVAPSATLAASGGGHAPAGQPDIVVFMVDDLAAIDHRVLDRLPTIRSFFLEHGVEFTDYLGEDPLCCPGRASFLTGQWAHHHGVTLNDARLFDPSMTIATQLQAVGYDTIIAGKYLNDTQLLKDLTPPGWTHSLIYSGGYWGSELWLGSGPTPAQAVQLPPTRYTLSYIDRNAVAWIDSAPVNQPIFALLTPFAPHYADQEGTDEDPSGVLTVHQPSPDIKYLNDPRCQGIPNWDPPNYNEPDVSDKPAYIRALPPIRQYPLGWPLDRVCESLLSVDDFVGHVQAAMAAAGRTNVLYVFTDDNGMTWGAHRWAKKHLPYATPMSLFMHWSLELGGAPSQFPGTVQNIDLAPTFCAIAGCTLGPFDDGYGVDGVSLVPALLQSQPIGRQFVYEEYPLPGPDGMPAWWGVRTTDENSLGDWVFTQYADGECELYNLQQDPWQLHNRCNQPILSSIQSVLAQQVAQFRAH
jgi:arylsulfatase A-like enzyme